MKETKNGTERKTEFICLTVSEFTWCSTRCALEQPNTVIANSKQKFKKSHTIIFYFNLTRKLLCHHSNDNSTACGQRTLVMPIELLCGHMAVGSGKRIAFSIHQILLHKHFCP